MSQLRNQTQHKRLSRRTLLKGSLAAGTLVGMYGLVGCAPVQPASQSGAAVGGTTDQAASASPATIRIAHNLLLQGKESLDPQVRASFRAINDLLYDRLTRYSGAGLIGQLATSWESNETATEWTFTLREGVTFHDGTPFTAQDVVYSYQRVGNPELRSSLALFTGVIDLEKIEAVDDLTVRFPLKKPYADFPLVGPAGIPIIANGSAESILTTGNGTGAFKLEAFAPEGTTVLVANDSYWGEQAKLARMELMPIADGDARVNALLAGQIDFANVISRTQATLIEANPNYVFEVATGPLSFSYYLVMNTNTAPFDDVRVRKAMKLVVDRKFMLQTTVQGDGLIAYDHLIYPGDPLALKEEPPFDVEKAKALLAEAGYADGLEVTLYTSSGRDLFLPIAVTYKEMAAAAGINVTIKDHPIDSYFSEIYKQKPFFLSFGASPAAPITLDMAYRPDGPFNESGWNNKEAVRLLDEAFAQLDEDKRKSLYQDVQRLAQQEGGEIVPFFAGVGRAYHKFVKGLDSRNPFVDWAQVYIDANA